jgi:hypothetical protein
MQLETFLLKQHIKRQWLVFSLFLWSLVRFCARIHKNISPALEDVNDAKIGSTKEKNLQISCHFWWSRLVGMLPPLVSSNHTFSRISVMAWNEVYFVVYLKVMIMNTMFAPSSLQTLLWWYSRDSKFKPSFLVSMKQTQLSELLTASITSNLFSNVLHFFCSLPFPGLFSHRIITIIISWTTLSSWKTLHSRYVNHETVLYFWQKNSSDSSHEYRSRPHELEVTVTLLHSRRREMRKEMRKEEVLSPAQAISR